MHQLSASFSHPCDRLMLARQNVGAARTGERRDEWLGLGLTLHCVKRSTECVADIRSIVDVPALLGTGSKLWRSLMEGLTIRIKWRLNVQGLPCVAGLSPSSSVVRSSGTQEIIYRALDCFRHWSEVETCAQRTRQRPLWCEMELPESCNMCRRRFLSKLHYVRTCKPTKYHSASAAVSAPPAELFSVLAETCK